MSCGCKTSGDSSHSCGTKTANGCSSVDTCGNSYKLSVFDWLSDIDPSRSKSSEYVEVRFKNDRKLYYKNVNNLPLHIGSIIAVESSPGHDIGVVSLSGELVKIQMKKKNVSEDQALKIYRLASQKDIETWQDLRKKENAIKIDARKIAYGLNLEMKITDVEYQGDGSKVTFYYTADNRIDFRQLIKEYASNFRTKIDMKQIGFRQESAKVGGIGSCGRELCCSSWLTDFRSVNTNAARYQQLSINPQKLAGQCGKLKCCLNYELDSYLDVLRDFPSSSTVLNTEKGRAFCIKIDVFKKKMWFAYVENSMAWYDLDIFEVKKLIVMNKNGEKAPALEDLKVVENPLVTSDLIQENSVDRFEKKFKKSRSGSNRDRNPKQSDNRPPRSQDNKNPRQSQTDHRNRSNEQKPVENKSMASNVQSTDNKASENKNPKQNHNRNRPSGQKPIENKATAPNTQATDNQPQENKTHKKPFKKPKKKTPPKNEGNA
ncbi:regulatory iron-sulfur-containing complex subunit RicT [Epilithonimonas sp.]|uniref:PSP1 domain-containing protein n=1 Tax=Epilithonimonas sp. TaxID=2894511 RepID=UPI002896ED76|nr:regulatory iron-sulfur-containing complex subunit RicT [Epilithonimonas sp.]